MTLLFDDSKRLEKALGEEAAGVLINILEKQDEEAKRDLVTREYLDHRLTEMETKVFAKMESQELRLTIRFGAIAASAIAVVAAIVKLLS
ncbi:hypothetical protein [Solidesulfovibrio sp.]